MGTEKWHADIQIWDELAKGCIENQFPELSPLKEIKFLAEGWDNKVFLVNGEIIFRFPRRNIAVALIEQENKILEKLPPLFHIEIPRPKYIGRPSHNYPYPFQGYKRIEGVSGCHTQLSEQDRAESIVPLSIFLKGLHGVNESEALSIGAKSQVFDRTNVIETVAALNDRANKIIDRKIIGINKAHFQREIKIAQEIKLPSENKCLVHGDLYCKHLMFNKGKLTGVIDWGDIGINNRSVDLSVIWSFYPAKCHNRFFEIYGPVDLPVWQYARFLGLYSAFTIMLYGHDIGDTLLVTEAINSIKRIDENLLLKNK